MAKWYQMLWQGNILTNALPKGGNASLLAAKKNARILTTLSMVVQGMKWKEVRHESMEAWAAFVK